MKERDWLAGTDPGPMLEYLRKRASDRKLRLFAVACCLGKWSPLYEERSRKLLELAERHADGAAAETELYAARLIGYPAPLIWTIAPSAFEAASRCGVSEARTVAHLREVFGNPFRRVAVDPAWLTAGGDSALNVGAAIYRERRFGELPILADALEEAGCDNEDILAHCHQPGEHVRGCWVLDLLLGKE